MKKNSSKLKTISLIGSTGSIGFSTLRVVDAHPDLFEIKVLATYQNVEEIIEQAKKFRPAAVGVVKGDGDYLKRALPGIDVRVGEEGLLSLIKDYPVDRLVNALKGTFGLKPTLKAVEQGMTIALANKESVVSGGRFLMEKVKAYGATILPIDSEHSAIFQCLQAGRLSEVRRLILTASGGPFLHFTDEELSKVTPEQALKHPNWKMGPKVTVDSSTLMNKGLEVIEAHFLFGVEPKKIEVVIHPESIIHSMVEFIDRSMISQMGRPEMITPIQYALSFPDRVEGIGKQLDFYSDFKLSFYIPDLRKFPSLALCYQAISAGESYPPFLNKANELLVEKFLQKEISWKEIGTGLERALERHRPTKIEGFDTILAIEEEAEKEVNSLFALNTV